MLPALSVSKSVSAYSPSSSAQLKMTSVVVAVAAARERTKSAIVAMALIGKLLGDFMKITPPGACPGVKHILVRLRSSQPVARPGGSPTALLICGGRRVASSLTVARSATPEQEF